jgi:hypothetical protein
VSRHACAPLGAACGDGRALPCIAGTSGNTGNARRCARAPWAYHASLQHGLGCQCGTLREAEAPCGGILPCWRGPARVAHHTSSAGRVSQPTPAPRALQ